MVSFPVLSRRNLSHSSRRSTPKPCPFILLQTLFYPEPRRVRSPKTQLLCNQANPNSFTKTPGVGVCSAQRRQRNSPLSLRQLPALNTCPRRRRASALSLPSICLSFVFRALRIPISATPFLAHLYKPPGGFGCAHPKLHSKLQLSTLDVPYSEGPSGRKYCVPFTGSWRRRRSCWRSALRSTKSISEVLITSRSEAA